MRDDYRSATPQRYRSQSNPALMEMLNDYHRVVHPALLTSVNQLTLSTTATLWLLTECMDAYPGIKKIFVRIIIIFYYCQLSLLDSQSLLYNVKPHVVPRDVPVAQVGTTSAHEPLSLHGTSQHRLSLPVSRYVAAKVPRCSGFGGVLSSSPSCLGVPISLPASHNVVTKLMVCIISLYNTIISLVRVRLLSPQ